MVSEVEEKIKTALKQVLDPELSLNVVDLGLIYEINENDGKVLIKMTFTSPACPLGRLILESVKQRAEKVEGVKGVEVEVVFDPPWVLEMASEEIRVQFQDSVG